MNKLFNDQIIVKTQHIFDMLFNIDIKSGDIYCGKPDIHDWDISGVVGIVGHFEGVIVIRFKEDQAGKLLELSRVNSPDLSKRWHIINDMVGEVINNIVGNVLGEIGDNDIKNSVPITVQGDNHMVEWPGKSPINIIPFSCKMGDFEVLYSLAEK